MPIRTHYRNGDPIDLTYNGCDGCSPSTINGLLCHEAGCPEVWRDETRTCIWCESKFHPKTFGQQFCCNEDPDTEIDLDSCIPGVYCPECGEVLNWKMTVKGVRFVATGDCSPDEYEALCKCGWVGAS